MAFRIIILNSPGSARRFLGAVGRFVGHARKLTILPLSFNGFIETRDVAARALETNLAKTSLGRRQSLFPVSIQRSLLALQYNGVRRLMSKSPDAVALVWNGLSGRRLVFAEAARHAGLKRLFAELAPLPGYLTVDPLGINYENSLPRQSRHYHDWAAANPGEGDWRLLAAKLVSRKPRRGKEMVKTATATSPSGNFLFLPLQVPSDTQVTRYGGWIKSMESLIDAAHEASRHLPEGWRLVVKEHPTSRIRFAERILSLSDERFGLDNETDTFELVARSCGVVTLNSSVGLQAFLFDKPVIVIGKAFFGWEPLTHVAPGQDRLNALFAQADGLEIDPGLRGAFMRYLSEYYYIEASLTQSPYLMEAGTAKLRARLPPGLR